MEGVPSFIVNPELTTVGRSVDVGPIVIPGIGTGVAYAALDQFGQHITIPVPRRGQILEVRFHDLDDEGIDKELWLFRWPPVLAADNAAFSLSDTDNPGVVAIFLFSTWRDAVNNQIGFSANTPASYYAPEGVLYGALKTLGADNIAAGSLPSISLVIEPGVAV